MRIDQHTVDSAHGQAQIHPRAVTPPVIASVRRIQGVNQGTTGVEHGEAPPSGSDGISLDVSPEGREAARLAALEAAASQAALAGARTDAAPVEDFETGLVKAEAAQDAATREAAVAGQKQHEEVVDQPALQHLPAGNLAWAGATYSYRRGADGRLYAVDSDISVDTSAVPGDPKATLEKAESIRRAAMNPGNPSPSDLAVAALAVAMAARARNEIARQEAEASHAEAAHQVDTRQ